MIKIQDHLNRTDSEAFVSNLAEQHWNYLNKKKKDGTYYLNSLIHRCKDAKYRCTTRSYLTTIAESAPDKATRHKAFFEFISERNFKKLKEIIVGKPSELALLKNEILAILTEGDLYSINGGVLKQTSFGKFLEEEIFTYGTYRKSTQCRSSLLCLGFRSATCPYCNLSRLDVTVTKKEQAYLELDHFFLKAEHPYFALSFFNLVPSCHSCNATDKGSTRFSLSTHINPFHESFDKIYEFSFPASFFHGSKDDFQIENVSPKTNDITSETFNLEAKYRNRVTDLKSLATLFAKYKHKLGTAEEEMFIEMLMNDIPANGSDILKFELAKAKRDLLKVLDRANVLKIQ